MSDKKENKVTTYLKKEKCWQLNLRRGNLQPVPDPRPTKIALGKKKGQVVMIQPRTSGFKTEQEALDFYAYYLKESKNVDLSLAPQEKMEYITALNKLKDANITDISVLEIVQEYVKNRPAVTVEMTLWECYEEFMADLARLLADENKSAKTLKGYRDLKPAFAPFWETKMYELEQPTVAESLAKHINENWAHVTARTLQNTFVRAKRVLNWCVEKKYLTKQPLHTGLTKVEGLKNKRPYILTVEETERILETARATDNKYGLLNFWVIHIFCGLRPSEFTRLTWGNVKTESKNPFILVPEESTARNIDPRKIELKNYPNILEWLKICDRTKPFFRYETDSNGDIGRMFYKNRKSILDEAGIPTGKERKKYDDCGRHSCATYLYEKGASQKDISKRLGNTTKVLRKYYISSHVTEEEAERYFKVLPIKSEDKLVQFAG